MVLTLKNDFQFFGLVLIGIGLVYQEATPFFLTAGIIAPFLSAFFRPLHWKVNIWGLAIVLIWIFTLLSGFRSENLNSWGDLAIRQLALLFLPVAVFGGITIRPEQKTKIDLIWIGMSGLFALISLLRYLLHKEAVDQSLLESGAIPIWDGVSKFWELDAVNNSKFVQDGINHIYFSLIQALAILVSWFNWQKSRKYVWAVLGIIHLISIHWFLVRTGMLALYFAAGVLFIYFILKRGNKKWTILLLVLAILLPISSYFAFQAVQNKVTSALEDLQAVRGEGNINYRSLATRVEAWKTAWQLIRENPLGVGAGDVNSAMAARYEKNKTQLQPENRIPPHNQYLETALASGIAASLILIALLIAGIWHSWRKNEPLMLGLFSGLLIALCFESILQTQLGICLFPFALLFLNPETYAGNNSAPSVNIPIAHP